MQRAVLLSGLEQRAVEFCACVVIIIIQRSAIEKKTKIFNTIIFPVPAVWGDMKLHTRPCTRVLYVRTRLIVAALGCSIIAITNYVWPR